MSSDQPARRFGPGFVAGQQHRYGSRPPEGRQLSYDITVEPEYEPWRVWYDAQLALLPPQDADAFARKMWFDQNFWSDPIELAAGAALRTTGLRVEYERPWGNLTPDWTVLGKDGEPVALVEVLTDSPPKSTYGKMKAWHNLVERIKQIPVPVVLALSGSSDRPLDAPDARTAKKITQDLRRYLLSPLQQASYHSQGYTFLLQADRRAGKTLRPPGMRTILIPPSSLSGVVSAQPLTARIDEKVKKYRAIAEGTGLPLLIAAGAHKFTGVGVEQLDHLLSGQHTITLQFNYGDTFIHEPLDFQLGNSPSWTMPPDLAGVLWVDNNFPFNTLWRPNDHAQREAPGVLVEKWVQEQVGAPRQP